VHGISKVRPIYFANPCSWILLLAWDKCYIVPVPVFHPRWSQRVSERSPPNLVWEDLTALAKLPLPLPLPLLFYIPLTPPPPFLAPPLGILPLDLLLIHYCSTHYHHYHHNNHYHPTNLALPPLALVSSCLGHKLLHRLTPVSTHKPACEALALMIAFVPEITSAAPVS